MNDISNLDKDERIKALMFDNISKNLLTNKGFQLSLLKK
jgi:hypothetical protein